MQLDLSLKTPQTCEDLGTDEFHSFNPITDNDGCPIDFHYEKPFEEIKEDPSLVNHYWTQLDCDGDIWIAPGLHYVNRMAYFKTDKPWQEGQEDLLYWKYEEFEE